jgi:hypothetical protein
VDVRAAAARRAARPLGGLARRALVGVRAPLRPPPDVPIAVTALS